MRLKHNDRALVAERFDRVKQRLELARMVGVIVVNIRTVVLALELKPAVRTGESGEALSASFPVVTTSSRYGYSFWTFNIAFQRSVRGTKRILASELFRMKALEEGVSTAWRGTGTIPWERMLRSQAVAVMEFGRRTAAWSPFFNPEAVKALRQLRTISANSFQVTPIHVLDL